MKKTISIYIIIGIILIAALVYFNPSGISNKSKELYEKAISLESKIEEEVWEGFKISKYPLAIRKGNEEFVFYKGNVLKREAVLDVHAFTALEVDGEINILMLPFEDLDSLLNPTGISTDASNENHYIATIFHEGFHAYQWEFSDLFKSPSFESHEAEDILTKIDQEDSIRKAYENEMDILYNGINEKDKDKKEELIRNYINGRHKRKGLLKEKLSSAEFAILEAVENQYELIEGTAHYIELKTLELLGDHHRYEDLMESLKGYHNSNTKYYKSGMGVSLLLDELDHHWKDSLFQDGRFLFEILADTIGR